MNIQKLVKHIQDVREQRDKCFKDSINYSLSPEERQEALEKWCFFNYYLNELKELKQQDNG